MNGLWTEIDTLSTEKAVVMMVSWSMEARVRGTRRVAARYALQCPDGSPRTSSISLE